MIKHIIFIFAVMLTFSMGLFVSGCANTKIKHLSANDFLAQAKQIEAMNSASWTTYIGASATRAYLEYGDVFGSNSKSRTIVYWTELEGLPLDIRQKLKEGAQPWLPWHDKVEKNRQNKIPEGVH
jgi:hypothetical protein